MFTRILSLAKNWNTRKTVAAVAAAVVLATGIFGVVSLLGRGLPEEAVVDDGLPQEEYLVEIDETAVPEQPLAVAATPRTNDVRSTPSVDRTYVATNSPGLLDGFDVVYPEYRDFSEFVFRDYAAEESSAEQLIASRLRRFDNTVDGAYIEARAGLPKGFQCCTLDYNGEYFLGSTWRGDVVRLTPGLGRELGTEVLTDRLRALNPAFTNLHVTSVGYFKGSWVVGTTTNGLFRLDSGLSRLDLVDAFPRNLAVSWDAFAVWDGRLYVRAMVFNRDQRDYASVILESDDLTSFRAIRVSSGYVHKLLPAGNALVILEYTDLGSGVLVYSDGCMYDMMFNFGTGVRGICYNEDEGKFLCLGNGTVYESKNLIDWSGTPLVFRRTIFNVNGLEYVNGVYAMATGYEFTRNVREWTTWVFVSLDGVHWKELEGELHGPRYGYQLVKKLDGQLFLGGSEDRGTNFVYSTPVHSRFDRNLPTTLASRTDLERHVSDEDIHLSMLEKDSLKHINDTFDGYYSSLKGLPKPIESLSQLANDSNFATLDDVKAFVRMEQKDHPTYTIDEVDKLLSKYRGEVLNLLNTRLTLPVNDNNNLRFFLVFDHGKLKWMSEHDLEELRGDQLH